MVIATACFLPCHIRIAAIKFLTHFLRDFSFTSEDAGETGEAGSRPAGPMLR